VAGKEAPFNDPAQRDKAKEILHVLINAVSAAKLFPSDHQTVINFISDLHDRLSDYLDKHWKLELEIEEHAFAVEGERIFEDPHPLKSLPFFFFKDGLQRLYFYKGLAKEELSEFLETMRTVSQLPPEEGDIVTALWEKDFANIRYLAPDDYLETRIGVGRPTLRPRVDRADLSRGRVELAPEDLVEMKSCGQALSGQGNGPLDNRSEEEGPGLSASSGDVGTSELESLLKSSRQTSPEDEYLNLVVELIYLEDRADQFPAIVDVLEQYHQDIMRKKGFAKAAGLMRALSEIRSRLAKKDKRKAELIDSVISLLTRKSVLVDLKASFDPGAVDDLDGLFAYLGLFGPEAASLLADIYEQVRSPEWRAKALEMLTRIGQDDIQRLGTLIQESRPTLSQEIIRLLRESQDRQVVSFLAKVVSYKNPIIKLAAIRALGKITDEAANKLLLGFLPDPDEDVRVTALENLKQTEDRPFISHITAMIGEKSFAKKSAREKNAFFDFLARSDSEEACAFLAGILRKVPFLPNPKHTELCLLSVSALAGMKRPVSLDILKEGSKRRNLKIRTACFKALRSRSEVFITFTGRIQK
jgi:hypothetical protein